MTRALNRDGDWTFGNNKKDYLDNNKDISQELVSRLKTVANDCYYDRLLGLPIFTEDKVSPIVMENAIRSIVLGTKGVVDILEFKSRLENREFRVEMTVATLGGEVMLQL